MKPFAIALGSFLSCIGIAVFLEQPEEVGLFRTRADQRSNAVAGSTGSSSTHILEATKIQIAGSQRTLEPVYFRTSDGKKGWKVTIPGQRTLATPAVAEGKVFIGGGFGSHEFYAFDAMTGKKIWQYQTKDDGPTAAVVQDGFIAFNTESCELEILTLDGKRVWKKWLGDPLMSMPAMAKGKVYMAYPSRADGKHYIACFDLKTGSEAWKKPIVGEVITTPVIAADHVYLTTLEGTLYNFDARTGELAWSEKRNATSSPKLCFEKMQTLSGIRIEGEFAVLKQCHM